MSGYAEFLQQWNSDPAFTKCGAKALIEEVHGYFVSCFQQLVEQTRMALEEEEAGVRQAGSSVDSETGWRWSKLAEHFTGEDFAASRILDSAAAERLSSLCRPLRGTIAGLIEKLEAENVFQRRLGLAESLAQAVLHYFESVQMVIVPEMLRKFKSNTS